MTVSVASMFKIHNKVQCGWEHRANSIFNLKNNSKILQMQYYRDEINDDANRNRKLSS